VILRQRLNIKNVDGSAGDPPLAERFDKRRFFHDWRS
jgi:hypothetical protein